MKLLCIMYPNKLTITPLPGFITSPLYFNRKLHDIDQETGTDFLGGCGGVCTPPEMICTPPKSFGTPANYIYFDLIVSYLIILTTKFVKLPILWSQISPCRPRKQILLNFFLGLSGRCHHAPAKASSSTPQIFIHPPEQKYENPSLSRNTCLKYSWIVSLTILGPLFAKEIL